MTADIELGPKMQACSERERKFIWAYLQNGGNGAQAARDAGYSDAAEGAKVRAHAVLHRDRVLAAIEEVGRKAFRGLLIPAVLAAEKLIGKEDHADHAKMTLSVLSRLGFGERTGLDVSVSGEVTLNHTDAALDDLRALKALMVPREKLVEVFGYSGLDRYEKMLAVADQRVSRETGGPVIEHEASDEKTIP